jgi:hypothetical protein
MNEWSRFFAYYHSWIEWSRFFVSGLSAAVGRGLAPPYSFV